MKDLEEALRNIDAFCRILVKKIVQDEERSKYVTVEPIENLLRRKYILDEHSEPKSLAKHMIPLPHLEKPLIDMFENNKHVKILMQCRCKDPNFAINTQADGLEICTEECTKIDLPIEPLQIQNMTVRCSNKVLEIAIPKTETSVTCGN